MRMLRQGVLFKGVTAIQKYSYLGTRWSNNNKILKV